MPQNKNSGKKSFLSIFLLSFDIAILVGSVDLWKIEIFSIAAGNLKEKFFESVCAKIVCNVKNVFSFHKPGERCLGNVKKLWKISDLEYF